jgi:aminoglycoside phosphotransferase (APT) family kinase protein
VEQRYGGRHHFAQEWRERVAGEIKSTTDISVGFRTAFVAFLEGYAQAQIESGTTVTHRELAHNHVYLDRQGDRWSISGLIDWADSTIGPPEWDTAFVWFWTFTRDREAMRRFLRSRYVKDPMPEALGKRCLAAILQTYEGPGLWKEILAYQGKLTHDPIGASVELLFPADTFE